MRNHVPAYRLQMALKVASVVLLAGVAASCSNSSRFDRLFTGSTANQRDIIGSGRDQPLPAPVSDVSRRELPPPPTQIAANGYGNPMAVGTADPTTNGPYAWSAVGGTVITVARGETLDAIAMKFGVPHAQILSANQLTSPAQIRPGQVLVIPHRVAIAPDAPQWAPTTTYRQPATYAEPAKLARVEPPLQPAMPAGGSEYVVQSGDTLYSISRRFGTTVSTMVALNGLTSPNEIRIGQALRLPGATATGAMAYAPDGTPPATPPMPKLALRSPAETAASGSQFAGNAPRIPAVPAIPVNAGAPMVTTVGAIDADPPSADGTSFRWPVRGRIISAFGAKPNGERNDGINLAVPEGTSVKAIEAGTVIYAGNELEGYGNLVLIRHADGWVSAYAHNRDILVSRGDAVRRGQTIGHAGMTGSVSSPQVHFELRKGAKPVNPLDHLTG